MASKYVWRIEDAEGLGPYRGGVSTDDFHALHNPSPWRDKHKHHASRGGLYLGERMFRGDHAHPGPCLVQPPEDLEGLGQPQSWGVSRSVLQRRVLFRVRGREADDVRPAADWPSS